MKDKKSPVTGTAKLKNHIQVSDIGAQSHTAHKINSILIKVLDVRSRTVKCI